MAFGGIEAGKAFIKFLLDDKQFKKGLAGTATRLKKFGAIGLAATAPLIAGFSAATRIFTSAGDELAKMSQRTGLSVESLSELKYAADQSGTSLGAIERATKKMAVGMLDAAKGSGTLYESLDYLGLSLDQIEGLAPEQQFLTLARAIANVEDPTLRAALAQKVFGKSGTELLPMLAGGVTVFDQLRQRAHDLGLTMDQETAEAAVRLGDNLSDLLKQVLQMGIEIGNAVAGPLTDFALVGQDVLKWVIDFIKENPTLVRAIGYITAAIGTASSASIVFGTILSILTAHPIIATLAAIAALALLVAKYFGWIGDAGGDMQKELDQIKGIGDSLPAQAQRNADAAATQRQLESSVYQPSVIAPTSSYATGLESAFAKQALEEIAKYTGESAGYLRDLLQLARTGKAGFIAGTG